MICENCGGNIKALQKFYNWISGECENCKMSYAFRPDKQMHKKTLMHVYGESFNSKMKEYKKRVEELTQHAIL